MLGPSLRRLPLVSFILACGALALVFLPRAKPRDEGAELWARLEWKDDLIQTAYKAVRAAYQDDTCTTNMALVGAKISAALKAAGASLPECGPPGTCQIDMEMIGEAVVKLTSAIPKENKLAEYPPEKDGYFSLLHPADDSLYKRGRISISRPIFATSMKTVYNGPFTVMKGQLGYIEHTSGDPGLVRHENGSLVMFTSGTKGPSCLISNDDGITWGPVTPLIFENRTDGKPTQPHPVWYPQPSYIGGRWYMLTFPRMYLWEAVEFPTLWSPRQQRGHVGCPVACERLEGPYFEEVAPNAPDVTHPTLLEINGGAHAMILAGTDTGLLGFHTPVLQMDDKRSVKELMKLYPMTWTPHPMNPLETKLDRVMPAGKLFTMPGTSDLIRPAQDISLFYGRCIKAYKVTKLSTTEFEEEYVGHIAGATGFGRDAYTSHVMGIVPSTASNTSGTKMVAWIDGAPEETPALGGRPGGKVPRIDPKMLYAFKESFFGLSDEMLEGLKAIFMYEKV